MVMNFNKRKFTVFLSVLLIFIVVFLVAVNQTMKIVYYTVETAKQGDQIRLVLITDLHSCKYGDGQTELIEAVDAQNPDVVLFGGDIFDDEIPFENSKIVVEALAKKYLCFYVLGNHEYWSGRIDEIKQIVIDAGVTVLEGECQTLDINGKKINICGVDDPTEIGMEAMAEQMSSAIDAADEEAFTILLSHRPELIDDYRSYGFDLILSGHAHGGQWRIPGILNGLYAPDQGLFPKYAGGRYDFDDAVMIVSRGLARESTKIPRIFNQPELVVIDLV